MTRRSPSRLLLAAAAALVLATVAGPAAVAAPAAGTGGGTAFTPPLPLDTTTGGNTGAAEPSIAVDSKGNVYVSGPVGVPSGGCPFWYVHPDTLNSAGKPYDYRGTFDTDYASVGGGDCDISTLAGTGTATTPDTVAVSSLSLANLTTNTSTDAGATFRNPANTVGQQIFGVDRQWQAADPSLGRTYLSVHDLYTDNIQVSVSTDGGFVYTQNTPAIDTATFPAAQGNNHFGTSVVNPVTHRIYIPFIAPASAQENTTGSGNRHVFYVAEGDPCATVACTKGGPVGPISWTDHVAYTAPATQNIDHIFPAIGLDAGGTVYLAFAGDTGGSATSQISVLHMTTPGDATKWTAPQQVSDSATHANMFPWLEGGQAGSVALVWYAATLRPVSGSTCPTGSSGTVGDNNGVNNNCFNTWSLQYAASNDTGATFTPTTADPRMHDGSICDQGLTCNTNGGDRTLLDFFDVDIDPAGGANIAYASDTATPGTAQITYTRQCTGPSLRTGGELNRSCAALVPPPPVQPASVCSGTHLVTDPAGDVANPTGGTVGNDTADATDVSVADAAANITVTETLANLSQVPPEGATFTTYYVTWKGPDGKQYGVSHTEPGTGSYTVGEFDPSTNRLKTGTTSSITGSTKTGPNGTVTWNVPKAKVGNPVVPVDPTTQPTANPAMTGTYAVVILGEGVAGSGLVFTQPADRAPNAGGAPAWSVCTAGGPGQDVPEAPLALGLPLAGLVAAGAWVWGRRRRSA